MKEKEDSKPAKPLDATEAHVELYEMFLEGGEKALREYAERIVREREEQKRRAKAAHLVDVAQKEGVDEAVKIWEERYKNQK